ncbi:MAG TPA: DUF3892 domain-containing protein [Candidatus Saccharimonadales bacterium]|nr:DUF3892 domain-containing protein [Candidatus Saccharimonadales bacterium]
MALRITGIRKDNGNHNNPHEAVTDYRWENDADGSTGISSRMDMVNWLESNQNNEAYVRDMRGKVYCYVNTNRYGTKFLQTYADNRWTDNLLSLPEC